ncbi:unnamed protein product [Polarella glacialis]|uniref:Uncharacterized protein n=1 Tax=Polarella glacialis TaxID=89957 RepID=A0A813LYZ7_POLGL|nr:unnamed protein product [Polarella glacialis]
MSATSLEQALLDISSGATEVDVSDQQIGDDGVVRLAEALTEALESSSTVIDIYLDGNGITDQGVECLAEFLEKSGSVVQFSLYNNSVTDAGATRLARSLACCAQLQTLDLRENAVADAGASALAEALERGAALQFLLLKDNDVGDDGAKRLAEAVRRCGSGGPLRQLDLESNKITALGSTALKEVRESTKKEIQCGYQKSEVRQQHTKLIDSLGQDGVFASR